ncbi:MAG: GDP-mannose 4,6-dehydratase [Alphaproteobacteria bacterium]|nr:GDP-mannose 4,6-dehydratase [Alphaproteobacteria bacterium]
MRAQKTALITGVTGQDGAYLTKLLLEKNYHVVGAMRRASTLNLPRLAALGVAEDVELMTLDMQDFISITQLIKDVAPDEIYNLGGQSSVQASFKQPLYTAQTSGRGTMSLLEAMRIIAPEARLFEAASSEIFGQNPAGKIDESHDFHPRSPYGVAKLFAYWSVVNYREAYNLHASNGLMFNHESPLRGMEFVTRKITTTLAQIACGGQQQLMLGNVDNARDWGFAGDYVEAMWLMLQQETADDYIVASGETHSVREFVILAAAAMGVQIEFEGEGLQARGIDKKTGRQLVSVSEDFYRPSEPDPLVGDASKAHKQLDWRAKLDFEDLVTLMAEHDLARAKGGQVWY